MNKKVEPKLRRQLQKLANKMNDLNYQERRDLFGRIATIVEASISDPEQRKSIKDLVSNVVYSDGYAKTQISWEFEQFAKAQGFELWDNTIALENARTIEPMNPYTEDDK